MRRFAWLMAVLLITMLAIPSARAFQDDKKTQQQAEQKEQKAKKFKGDIAEVGKDFIKVSRKKADGKITTRKFALTDKTKIVFDGKEVKIAVLKKGVSVMVKFVTKADKSQVAVRISNKDDEEEQPKKTT
jgi:hypothetical protein